MVLPLDRITSAYNQSRTSREVVQLRRVHTITDRLSMANTYLVDEERLIVIDPCSERNVRLLFKYVQHVLRRPIRDIDLIVLTHLQPDQRAATEALRHFCRAPIAASAVVEQWLAEQWGQINIWLHDVEGLPGHPDWRIIACPGRTPESLCLYNPFTRELLSGETIVTIRWGTPLVRGSVTLFNWRTQYEHYAVYLSPISILVMAVPSCHTTHSPGSISNGKALGHVGMIGTFWLDYW